MVKFRLKVDVMMYIAEQLEKNSLSMKDCVVCQMCFADSAIEIEICELKFSIFYKFLLKFICSSFFKFAFNSSSLVWTERRNFMEIIDILILIINSVDFIFI